MNSNDDIDYPDALVQQFRRKAPENIQKVAMILAMVPISRSMIRLIQTDILQDPMPSRWAEMLLSNLLCPLESGQLIGNYDQRKFISGVREAILQDIPVATAQNMAEVISETIILQFSGEFQHYIFETMQQYLGPSFSYFEIFLLPNIAWRNNWLRSQMLPFTQAATKLAHDWGGHYQEVADRFNQTIPMGVEQ